MASTSIEERRGIRRAILVSVLAAVLSACGGGVPRLAPVPENPTSVEGDGSLSLTGPGGSAKSRFSFVLIPPARARIDVFDPLGRLVYFLLVAEDEALMAVPSKKAFSRGDRDEVFARFLGFGLSPSEMASLLTGRWPQGPGGPEEPNGAEWSLRRDEQNRVAAAARDGLRFEVKEFFRDSPAARLIVFEHNDSRGRLKVYHLAFNRPRPGATDAASLLKGYAEKTWEEMEALLGDED